MNPRRRRLLIPGLLVLLLLAVVIATVTDRADANPINAENDIVERSRFADARINESSGLALSSTDPDVVFTINDSGHADVVYAVQISTGETVGVTELLGTDLRDTEALALHDGKLWIADTGDNLGQRDSVQLAAIAEPARGDTAVPAEVFTVTLPDGPRDIETLLVDPTSGQLYLVTKSFSGGDVYRVPALTDVSARYSAEQIASGLPSLLTDGAFAPDGGSIAVINYLSGSLIDPRTWTVTDSFSIPPFQQTEGLTFLNGDSVLISTEGLHAPLTSIALPSAVAEADPANLPQSDSTAQPPLVETELTNSGTGFGWDVVVFVVAGALVVAVSAMVVTRKRRQARSPSSEERNQDHAVSSR